ncbi:DEAD/DEAH box helicase [Dysgonomonas sp. Marseille-Q5470]|uniref:DEAD/DEAH box helicase n=1 Tax=Dysgonomonas sp. Marseille-Q5470 TaxID=3039494 RepID=UPI0024BC3459|nr:DEAD/DEAH box helicase [Dysgonomonas sp. Marseille-Q5470]
MKNLTRLRDINLFRNIFKKLTLNEVMSLKEQEYILSISLLFIHYYNKDKKTLSYLDIAYYIILKYSLNQDNYEPLLDFSSQFGFYPIVKWIRENKLINESILDNIQESAIEAFFKNPMSLYIETLEQNNQRTNIINNPAKEISYIAPTSFGKSEIIQEYLHKYNDQYHKVGVIVPSKSLLVQTYKSLKERNLNYKFILHDEMYNGESDILGILTQERASSLIRRKKLVFDILFIDEAHNLLDRDNRSLILARLIESAKLLNPELKIIYLSPLIEDSRNLAIGDSQIEQYSINFNIKSYEIYVLSNSNELSIYDKYIDVLYPISVEQGYFECIINHSLKKNFIYTYRPKLVEILAKELYNKLPQIEQDASLREIINILKSEVHELFYVTQILDKGVLFIHGKIPDLIKEFLEYCFKNTPTLKYLIANSVILEGINLPIDRLFITNTRSLYGKELTNLIGRVNRLNYVFNQNNLSKLIPHIFFLENKEYNSGYESMINKIKLLRKRTFPDEVTNPNLKEYNDKKNEHKDEDKDIYLQNNILINSLINPFQDSDEHVLSHIVENQIYEFYDEKMTFDGQKELAKKINAKLIIYKRDLVNQNYTLLDKIYFFFVLELMSKDNNDKKSDKAIKRLHHEDTRNFYTNFITNIIRYSISDKIKWFYNNFLYRIKENKGILLYVGHSFGEVNRESQSYDHSQNVYVNLENKSEIELINLALVKLKIEEDFVSFKLNKMIFMLYDLEVISEEEYNSYVYGTTDIIIINYCKLGLSISSISKLILDDQIHNIALNEYGNIISKPEFWEYVNTQPKLFQFEIRKYIIEN